MSLDPQHLPGMLPKHLAVLDLLRISTPSALVQTDRREIHRAMRRLRPRPSLEAISQWQDSARDADPPERDRDREQGWEPVASFVVSFEQRGRSDDDRRLVVEQAEHAPPQPRRDWPGWPVEEVAGWMATRLAGLDRTSSGRSDAVSRHPAAARPSIQVEHLGLTTRSGSVDLLGPDAPTALDVPDGARLTARLLPVDAEVRAALRIRRRGRTSKTLQEVSTDANGTATLALTDLPPGSHHCVLAAWTDGGAAQPIVTPLPVFRRTP